MRFSSVLATAAFVLSCSAAPAPSNHIIHEKRSGEPHQWARRERAIPHQVLPIRIALRERNIEHADRFIFDVADPSSPNFGKLPTGDEDGPTRVGGATACVALMAMALCTPDSQHILAFD